MPMPIPLPTHFAVTDALVALTGAWGGWYLGRIGRWAGAAGLALFGLAGAIGTIRIIGGLDAELAALHRFASQTGGLIGLLLILHQIRGARPPLSHPFVLAALLIVAALLSVAVPMVGAVLFVAGLLCGAWLLWRGTGQGQHRIAAALGFALMLPNVLLVRASPMLSADAAWHGYHLIVALWLCLTARTLTLTPSLQGRGARLGGSAT